MSNISDNYGVISKCTVCTNPNIPIHCKNCFCRGFVAVCLACSGTGQITVPVAGAASGDMRSTCPHCGGVGHYGVSKPANWDVEHAPEQPKVEARLCPNCGLGIDDNGDGDCAVCTSKAFENATAGAKEDPVSVAALQEMAENLRAPDQRDPVHSETVDQLARSIYEDGKADTVDPMAKAYHEMQEEDKLSSQLKRPVSVHWKKWEKMSYKDRLAAIEAAEQSSLKVKNAAGEYVSVDLESPNKETGDLVTT